MMKRIAILPLICIALLATGCSSIIDLTDTKVLYRHGDYGSAYKSLQTHQDAIMGQQGPIIMNLDAGMLSRLTGDWKTSNARLEDAEREIQEHYTESISANIATYIINDNTKAYQGEDFENIYVNVFKALNYLQMGDDEGAGVELRRSIEKQVQLKDRYEQEGKQAQAYAYEHDIASTDYSIRFSSSALANYLSLLVANTLGETDLADYSYRAVLEAFSSQPDLYPFPVPQSLGAVKTPQKGTTPQLHVLAFNGLVPEKTEAVANVEVSRNNWARIAFPVMKVQPSPIASVTASVDGGDPVGLSRIESIDAIAVDTFQAKSALLRMKATVRAMSKAVGAAIYDNVTEQRALKENRSTTAGEEMIGWLFKIFNTVSESADVRSSHFLPATAWVTTLTVSPGPHTVEIAYRGHSGAVIHRETRTYTVENGTTNLVESTCPF